MLFRYSGVIPEYRYCRISRRFDQPGHDKKIAACNNVLKGLCARNNLQYIDNSNIDESCLGIKKLHLNRKGMSYLANNLKHFIHDIRLTDNSIDTCEEKS